jgi:hypothetical protein
MTSAPSSLSHLRHKVLSNAKQQLFDDFMTAQPKSGREQIGRGSRVYLISG